MQFDETLPDTLAHMGIPALNTMQETALPAIQHHPNVVLLAPTGSGKTLAFLLPVWSLMKQEERGVQCLILSPTRELAIQIERVWQKMATGFKVNTCYGGHSMPIETQNLSSPPALLIGTPGRIVEHLNRKTFSPDSIRMLVLDEFDKSLSMGFQDFMSDILKRLPAVEKRIMVSATDKLSIPSFTGVINPKILNFNKEAEKSTDGLILKKVVSPGEDKRVTLFRLLCLLGGEPTLIFCNQRDTTEVVTRFLAEKGIQAAHFHGGLEQLDREKTLVQFRNGSTLFLVASDLAARGLDIPEVKNVVHYELPPKHTDFLHRNGRTARMHTTGTAFLLVGPNEPLPVYLETEPEPLDVPPADTLPEPSPWTTLYISGGKKDKLSKTDIVGFLTQKGHAQKDDIGIIELMDFMSFVAVKKAGVADLLKAIQPEKMKGKKYKIVENN
ncbi:MAG: DEAD/DEAH box helicase [Saprospiraceae bacterium]